MFVLCVSTSHGYYRQLFTCLNLHEVTLTVIVIALQSYSSKMFKEIQQCFLVFF